MGVAVKQEVGRPDRFHLLARTGQGGAHAEELHKGLIVQSEPLTAKQTGGLFACITGERPDHPQADCFDPHHAFVFYGADGKIIAHISICLKCGTWSYSPKGGLTTSLDWRGIKALLTDLNMPILKDDKAYTQLYEAKK